MRRHAVHVRSQEQQTENRTGQSTGVPLVEPKPLTTQPLHSMKTRKTVNTADWGETLRLILSATRSEQRFQRREV